MPQFLEVRMPLYSSSLFNVYGFVHRKYIPIYIQQDAILHSLFTSGNFSTCFGWYFHSSSGAHTTVSTAFGICHTAEELELQLQLFHGVTNNRCCRYSFMCS